jgi:gamma-glutamyltranspeptidase/glutathione hydrolase
MSKLSQFAESAPGRGWRLMSNLIIAVPIVFLFLANGALAGSASSSSGPEVLLGASVGDNGEVMYQLFVKSGPGKAMDLTCLVPNGMELVSGEKGKVTGNRVAWKVLKEKKVAGPYTFKARPAGVLKAGDQFRTVAEVRWGKGFNQRAFSNESVLAGVGDPAGLAVVGTNREAFASTAIVASAHPLVSQAGIEVLKKGGNAVDAAAAASFMLGVVDPMHSGLGGYGGFMVVYLAKTKEVWVVDFNTIVPSKASVNMYEILPSQSGWWVVKDNANFTGYKAISVPGMLSGMATALQRFGTKSLKEVMAPAIDVADKGFKINSLIAQATGTSNLPKFPASAAIYLKDGKPMQAGNLLVQKDLADTMRKIAEGGPDVFYKGEIAEAIVADMEKNGGLITREDLANYKALVVKPETGTYRGYEINFPPNASSGGTLVLQTLNILEGYKLSGLGPRSPFAMHLVSEAMKLAWADRLEYVADPKFKKAPLAALISKEYAKTLRPKINLEQAAAEQKPNDAWKFNDAKGLTNHVSIIDKEGNIVSMTQTQGPQWFGSGVTVPGTGVVFNNGMMLYSPDPKAANSIEPGKRAVTNMSPALVMKDGKPFLAVGLPGARRIPTSVLNYIVDIVDHGLTLQQSLALPRFHVENKEPMRIEKGLPDGTLSALLAMGHSFGPELTIEDFYGPAMGVLVDSTGLYRGGADPRPAGATVMGY